jgi:hypothetical protein
MPDSPGDRARMVERHLAARGVANSAVLLAIGEVPRGSGLGR